jgi:hypothetical protein
MIGGDQPRNAHWCGNCGTLFPSNDENSKYCSHRCSALAMHRERGTLAPAKEFVCANPDCENRFERFPSEMRTPEPTCSKECQYIWRNLKSARVKEEREARKAEMRARVEAEREQRRAAQAARGERVRPRRLKPELRAVTWKGAPA